jgi:hypothetical protein
VITKIQGRAVVLAVEICSHTTMEVFVFESGCRILSRPIVGSDGSCDGAVKLVDS